MKTIDAVCVIVIHLDKPHFPATIKSLSVFPKTKQGKKDATKLFHKLCLKVLKSENRETEMHSFIEMNDNGAQFDFDGVVIHLAKT